MSNKKNVIMLLTVGLIALLAGGYALVVAPFLEREAESAAEIENAEMQRDTAQLALTTAQAYEKEYPRLVDINQRLINQFPSTADIESLNNSIIDAASRAGIPSENITSITTTSPTIIPLNNTAEVAPESAPTTDEETTNENESTEETPAEPAPVPTEGEEATSPMARMEVSISAEGNMQALYDFVGYLQDMERVILITSTTSSLDAEGGTGVVTIRAYSYLYVTLDNPLTAGDNDMGIEDDISGQEPTTTTGEEVESTTLTED